VAKRTPQEVYADLVAEGASPAAAEVLTEISGAESGFDDAILGDTRLEDSTWGPSVGLFQIRTLKSETGTGGDRDISALAGNDLAQAAAAVTISGAGTNFTPWSTYSTGRYQDFASQVSAAIGTPAPGGGPQVTPVGTPATPVGGPLPTWGPSWLPWNWPSDAGNAVVDTAAQSLWNSVRTVVLEGLFAVFGVALVVAGAKSLAQPAIDKGKERAAAAADTAEKLAPLAAL